MDVDQAFDMTLQYLSIKDQLSVADTIFILGGATLSPAAKAAEISSQGLSDKICFLARGGAFSNPEWTKSEAAMYSEHLLELGVPNTAVFYDAICTNTYEEAIHSVPFMREHGVDPRSIILIARPLHQRRAFATFRKVYPSIRFINTPGDETITADLASIERASGEMYRLQHYAIQGTLEPQPMDASLIKAWNTLRLTLEMSTR